MAANWKMFKTRAEAVTTISTLCDKLYKASQERDVVIFAPFPSLADAVHAAQPCAFLEIGAQNFYPAVEGAFTGEVSAAMLQDVKVAWVLVGHSERRALFGESLELVAKKAAFALEQGLKVVFCVGETLEEREAGHLRKVLEAQLATLAQLPTSDVQVQNFAIAYEPVWAIGTGKVAGKTEIVEAHAIVRDILEEKLPHIGKNMRILYGGSVKPENATEIIHLANVDGVLVGGASLDAESFASIVLA